MIYTGKVDHVDILLWVLDYRKKHSLYANQKKCCFHQDEVQFLDYMTYSQDICMENKMI